VRHVNAHRHEMQLKLVIHFGIHRKAMWCRTLSPSRVELKRPIRMRDEDDHLRALRTRPCAARRNLFGSSDGEISSNPNPSQ